MATPPKVITPEQYLRVNILSTYRELPDSEQEFHKKLRQKIHETLNKIFNPVLLKLAVSAANTENKSVFINWRELMRLLGSQTSVFYEPKEVRLKNLVEKFIASSASKTRTTIPELLLSPSAQFCLTLIKLPQLPKYEELTKALANKGVQEVIKKICDEINTILKCEVFRNLHRFGNNYLIPSEFTDLLQDRLKQYRSFLAEMKDTITEQYPATSPNKKLIIQTLDETIKRLDTINPSPTSSAKPRYSWDEQTWIREQAERKARSAPTNKPKPLGS